MLSKIEAQTNRIIQELKWSEKEINKFVEDVNRALKRNSESKNGENDSTDNSLVVHAADYSGGFILFGGWTKIYDHVIPSGTRGHELYLAFGGVGAGGWKGKCDIELSTEGTFDHEGRSYLKPVNYYADRGSDWNNYSSAFNWFHDHVKSFMFMYLPVFAQPIPIFCYFDSKSNQIGISVPDCSLSIGIGGGSVKVES